ncbi:MAG: acylphosphatase [Steroidobacteraceae bacterium]
MIARRLHIQGRVQGVFYRQWTVNTATELGLQGWVRNRSDGTVEAQVQGDKAAVESFIEAARHGPPMAEVTRLEVVAADLEAADAFRKLSTLQL